MADAGQKAAEQLSEITECSICLSTFIDPRVLPCHHTFCYRCLRSSGETMRKKPGDEMPCPLCRNLFTIPQEGFIGLQRNFFMEKVKSTLSTLNLASSYISCDMCLDRNEGSATNTCRATKRCFECKRDYCDSCMKVHQMQTESGSHHLSNTGRGHTEEGFGLMTNLKSCIKHIYKQLGLYCLDCKEIICDSCFVETHRSHDCKDVATVGEEFLQTINKKAWKISNHADQMLSIRQNTETRKSVFLKKILERNNAIYKRSQALKDLIDQQTRSLFDQLSVVESTHLKKMDNEIVEIDGCCSALRGFVSYCNEMRSKWSASDICSSIDEVVVRAQELESCVHESFICRPLNSVDASFLAPDHGDVLQKANNNLVGQIRVITETTAQFENCAMIMGLNYATTITEDVLKINLHRPNETSSQTQIPTVMDFEAVAAVYCNTMYVTGVGTRNDEIWKYSEASGWKQCASLVQGRRRHSAAFVDEVLYICGGFADSDRSVLNSVEAYDVVADKCSTVGNLLDCVQNAGNCVPYKSLLYIFGGVNKDNNALSRVQVYDTRSNKCMRIFKPMPPHCNFMRAALWKTSVVLLGWATSFIFNLETETWQERRRFKTGVANFGLVIEDERVFIIGGGLCQRDQDGNEIWRCSDDVRYVPLQSIVEDKPIAWRIHSRLPKPALVQTYSKLTLLSSGGKPRAFRR